MNIPYAAKSKRAAPVMACVAKAAREMECSEPRIAHTMNVLFEEIANQMSLGRLVRIPGFGLFGQRPSKVARRKGKTYYAAFSAARGWRNRLYYDSMCSPRDAALGGKRLYPHYLKPSSQHLPPEPKKERLAPIWPTSIPRRLRPLWRNL